MTKAQGGSAAVVRERLEVQGRQLGAHRFRGVAHPRSRKRREGGSVWVRSVRECGDGVGTRIDDSRGGLGLRTDLRE